MTRTYPVVVDVTASVGPLKLRLREPGPAKWDENLALPWAWFGEVWVRFHYGPFTRKLRLTAKHAWPEGADPSVTDAWARRGEVEAELRDLLLQHGIAIAADHPVENSGMLYERSTK